MSVFLRLAYWLVGRTPLPSEREYQKRMAKLDAEKEALDAADREDVARLEQTIASKLKAAEEEEKRQASLVQLAAARERNRQIREEELAAEAGYERQKAALKRKHELARLQQLEEKRKAEEEAEAVRQDHMKKLAAELAKETAPVRRTTRRRRA